MSGVTKHIFNQEVRDILSMWDCEIKTIEPLLPKEYSSGDIIKSFLKKCTRLKHMKSHRILMNLSIE